MKSNQNHTEESQFKTLKRIMQAIMLLLLITTVVISCKKDNPEPDPVVPPTEDVPPVFPDKKICIMSEYETTRNLPFSGHKVNKLGTGLLGSAGKHIWEGLNFVGEVVWEAFDFHNTEANFEDIKDQLDDIQNQIDVLNSTIENLADAMNVDFAKLSSYISSTALNQQIAYVQTAMGGGSYNQLMFYPNVAARYQADSTNAQNKSDMADLKLHAHGFANKIYGDMSPASMTNVINNMNQLLCPTVGNGDNALSDYAKTLLDECKGKVHDSATAMQAYLMLESYFLKVVNYQFQAATVMVNACNMLDHNGQHNYASTFWNSEMGRIIPEEVDVFLSTVDYMTANLSEYRTKDQFIHDMGYACYGLAPENMYFHVLARSRFLANLLYEASGSPRPVICGSIMVPHIYSTDASNPEKPNPITVNIGASSIQSNGAKYASMLPYTYWDADKTCHPDNNWDLYNFSTSATDTTWACTPQTIQIVSSSPTSPWPHSLDISWSITPLYYNPANPSQTSTTRTADCSFQFAYSSTSWRWGYLLLSNPTEGEKLHNSFNAENYNPKFRDFPLDVQSYSYYDITSCTMCNYYYQNNKTSDVIKFSYPKYAGKLKASGDLLYFTVDKSYSIMDARIMSVKTADILPDGVQVGSNAIEAWALCNGFVNNELLYPDSNQIAVSIGTRYSKVDDLNGDLYHVYGDLIKHTYVVDKAQYSFPTRFNKVEIEKNKSYVPGVQYFNFLNHFRPNDRKHISIELNYAYQFIYTGNYNCPDPPK